MFEGEYLNGKRNGKGKEYYYNKELIRQKELLIELGYDFDIIFEGEYLNGEKNGKGKEYYENGVLKFEGEYLNGDRNGKGNEYIVFPHVIPLLFLADLKKGISDMLIPPLF